jgi:hypothetical protein
VDDADQTRRCLRSGGDNIQSQWQGKSPALNVRWLETHTALREIGRSQPFVLFEAIPKQATEAGNNLLLPAIGD